MTALGMADVPSTRDTCRAIASAEAYIGDAATRAAQRAVQEHVVARVLMGDPLWFIRAAAITLALVRDATLTHTEFMAAYLARDEMRATAARELHRPVDTTVQLENVEVG